MVLSSNEDKREEMGIEELTLDGWAYKENPLYQQNKRKKKRKNKEPTRGKTPNQHLYP